MNTLNARKVSLEKVLSYWQISPQKFLGDDVWYKSPLRPTEKTPSFKINRVKNLWYDHGLGKGGNVIDLVMLYESCSFQDALHHLSNVSSSAHVTIPTSQHEKEHFQSQVSTQNLTINKIQELENKALMNYLKNRNIPYKLASQYLKEIYFENKGKQLFALGFENDQGGYETRNKYFKGCLGTKAITYLSALDGTQKQLAIFEGFMDFLSYLALLKVDKYNGHVIVLNSIALKEKALQKISELGSIKVDGFLDNDPSGLAASQYFQKHLENFTSWSDRFLPSKDVNEYLCSM
jgi:hypothetical protein